MKRFTKAGVVAVAALGLLLGGASAANAAEPRTTVTVQALPIKAATCTTDGALEWTSNAPAQNINGYEFYDLGYRVYLNKEYTGPGTYVATVYRVSAGAAGYENTFPYGTNIVAGSELLTPGTLNGTFQQTLVVDEAIGYQSTDPSAPCFVALEAQIRTLPFLQDRNGDGQDKVIFPTDSTGGTWKISSVTSLEDGAFKRFRIAFTPDENYVLPTDVTWDRTVDGKAVWLFYADSKGHVDTVFQG